MSKIDSVAIEHTMTNQNFFRITTIIFSIVGLVHLARILIGFPIMIGNFDHPMWLSWIEMLIAFYLSYKGFWFGKK